MIRQEALCLCGGLKPPERLVCDACFKSAPQQCRQTLQRHKRKSALGFGERMAAKNAMLEHARHRARGYAAR